MQSIDSNLTKSAHAVPAPGAPPPRRARGFLAAAALLLPLAAGATERETITTQLNNPRGIAFAPNGELYVVEAGSGGPGACIKSPVFPFPPRCFGTTGKITRIRLPDGAAQPFVTRLPSLGLANGTAEGGVADLSFQGMVAFVQMGWGGDPTDRTLLPAAAGVLGKMLRVLPNGRWSVFADPAGHELVVHEPPGKPDTNPYGVAALPGRRIVADAGSNSLLEIDNRGRVRTLLSLPPLEDGREAVPTSVVEGPDGALYVGLLTGATFTADSSIVKRVSSDGSQVSDYATGFTAVIDLAFDAGGALYVLEVGRWSPVTRPFAPGSGTLRRKCSPNAPIEEITGNLTYPGGVAVGPDGDVYVTNFGTSNVNGQVLRLRVAPCP